ncbi:MAG TPA: OmpH family outer membrane protein [Acidobacteriaceae bacterium]|jgi:outer membrane protein|nr:OmpH family outer membrane protein [Acidobacteriaceae bacterium]
MNRTLVIATALAAGLAVPSLLAQAPAAEAPSAQRPAAARAAVNPEPIPAKIAIIAFEQAVVATNEGQRAVAEVQKKYEPQKSKIDSEGAEVESLRKQEQALPANTTDDERANRLRVIDTKEKALQRDEEDASNAYQGDLQEAYGKVAQKVGVSAVKYCQANGYTLLLNVGGSQQAPNPVLWAAPTTDVTQAVINAYNTSSGIAPPPPAAPTPHRTAPTGAAHPTTH